LASRQAAAWAGTTILPLALCDYFSFLRAIISNPGEYSAVFAIAIRVSQPPAQRLLGKR
jgi:hypothetical protein